MNPRRIARVITRLNIGGPSIQAINLTSQLDACGFDTRLLHGKLADAEGDMRTLLPLDSRRARYLDRLVRPISPLNDLLAWWRIYRLLCEWQPHIVHTHMAKAGALGRLAAVAYNRTKGRRQPARLIHTYHGHVFEGYFGSPSTKVFLAVERWLARRSQALIAISPQVRHDLTHSYQVTTPEKVRLIPLGFNLERLLAIGDRERARARQVLNIPDGAMVVSTVGRLTAIKQHTLFLDAARQLLERVPSALFLIVGDGELRAELEAGVAARELHDRVRFLGWRGDLDMIYGATDIFMLTSRNEGTPVALIEAMASGVASVSTDVGGVRDVIAHADCGSLVPFGDAAALSAAAERFAEAPSLRRETGERARQLVAQHFDGRRLVSDIARLYDELLAS